MYYRLGADLLVILHLGFILFAASGGLLVAHRLRLAMLHLPTVLWGALIELKGWICPLTPLEIRWRELAGQSGYCGGFIEPCRCSHGRIGISLPITTLDSFLYAKADPMHFRGRRC